MSRLSSSSSRQGRGDELFSYSRVIEASPCLTVEKERALGMRIMDGDRQAIEELVCANLRLLVGIAKTFSTDIDREDLISHGSEGLFIAAERFDPAKGRFSSFATKIITRKMIAVFWRHKKNRMRLGGMKSLDKSDDPEDRDSLAETLPIIDGNPAEHAIASDESRRLRDAIDKLNDKQRFVIKNHSGLDCEPQTLQIIADRSGVSKAAVSDMMSRTLNILKDLLSDKE